MDRRNLIIMCLLSLFLPFVIVAKDKKIKLAKEIVYIGEVVNKLPSGHGVIRILSSQDKNNFVVEIEGVFNSSDNSISQAKLISKSGLKINFNSAIYSVKNDKSEESISLQIAPNSILSSPDGLEVVSPSSFTLNWVCSKETDKLWIVSILPNNNIIGVIDKGFFDFDKVIKNLDEQEENLMSQRVSVCITSPMQTTVENEGSINIQLIKVLTTILKSGIRVEYSANGYRYQYPNGNYITIDANGQPRKAIITLEDGILRINDNGTVTINYANNDVFSSSNRSGIGTNLTSLAAIQKLSDIKID